MKHTCCATFMLTLLVDRGSSQESVLFFRQQGMKQGCWHTKVPPAAPNSNKVHSRRNTATRIALLVYEEPGSLLSQWSERSLLRPTSHLVRTSLMPTAALAQYGLWFLNTLFSLFQKIVNSLITVLSREAMFILTMHSNWLITINRSETFRQLSFPNYLMLTISIELTRSSFCHWTVGTLTCDFLLLLSISVSLSCFATHVFFHLVFLSQSLFSMLSFSFYTHPTMQPIHIFKSNHIA